MRENKGYENKLIRRIRCTYSGFFNKNSSPNTILKINAIEEYVNENKRIRRKQVMNISVLGITAKVITLIYLDEL
jgi:hypothetical protein